MPEGKPEGSLELGAPSFWEAAANQVFTETPAGGTSETPAEMRLRRWPLPAGPAVELGTIDWRARGVSRSIFAPDGESWLYARATALHARGLPVAKGTSDRILGQHSTGIVALERLPDKAGTVWTRDSSGEQRQWTLIAGGPPHVETIPKPTTAARPPRSERSDRWLVDSRMEDARVKVWRRGAWIAARPLELRRSGSWYLVSWTTHPSGEWLVASTDSIGNLTFWPLRRPYPIVVDGYATITRPIAFSPHGVWLASSWADRSLRLWPLVPGRDVRPLPLPGPPLWENFAFDPKGRFLFAVGIMDHAWMVPLDGRPAKRLPGFSADTLLFGAAVSPSGRYAATAFCYGRGEKTLRRFDLETGAARSFGLPEPAPPSPPPGQAQEQPSGYETGIWSLAFADDSTLYTGGHGGVRRWDLTTGRQETVIPAAAGLWTDMRIHPEKGVVVTREWPPLNLSSCHSVLLHDLVTRSSRPLPAFGSCVLTFELDRSGVVAVTGDKDGIVRVGRLSAPEPHLLVGHKGVISAVAISADLRWIASSGEDNTLRLWPMPDLDKPPLHTLPHDELVAKLRSLTNLRAVRDPATANGWTIELGRFPGWKDVPTW